MLLFWGGGGGGGGGEVCLDILVYLKVLYHGSANLLFTLHIPITNIEKGWPSETPPSCLFVICILHTEQTNACLFSEGYIYSPSCLPQTRKVVVSSQLHHWLLVCFGQLYNEIHLVRNRKFIQVLP